MKKLLLSALSGLGLILSTNLVFAEVFASSYTKFKPESEPTLCLRFTHRGSPVSMSSCHDDITNNHGQIWRFSWVKTNEHKIYADNLPNNRIPQCIDDYKQEDIVGVWDCHNDGNQRWKPVVAITGSINLITGNNYCMEYSGGRVEVAPCNNSAKQRWIIEGFDPTVTPIN